MGLFSNDKKPCPICGKATPRLLAAKIANKTPICSECSRKISMRNDYIDDLTVDALREHLEAREENKSYLENTFQPTVEIPIGFTKMKIDEGNRVWVMPLLMCGDTQNPPIFQFDEVTGYKVFINNGSVIESYSAGDTAPSVNTSILNLSLLASNLQIFKSHDDNKQDEKEFVTFKMKIALKNTCWNFIEVEVATTELTDFNAPREVGRILEYISNITGQLIAMCEGMNAMDAPRSTGARVSSIEDEIKKHKDLLDADIITQSEFDQKKKQLLGI